MQATPRTKKKQQHIMQSTKSPSSVTTFKLRSDEPTLPADNVGSSDQTLTQKDGMTHYDSATMSTDRLTIN